MKHQRLGGNLHDHTVTSCVHHLSEIFLNHIRFRCGIDCRNGFLADNRLDGSNQSHMISGIFQNRFYHISGRRFSFGSGHTDGLQLSGRMSEISRGDTRQSIPGVRYLNHRDVLRHIYILFHHKGCRAFVCHFPGERMTVNNSTSNTYKQIFRLHLSGIVHHIRNVKICAPLTTGIL